MSDLRFTCVRRVDLMQSTPKPPPGWMASSGGHIHDVPFTGRKGVTMAEWDEKEISIRLLLQGGEDNDGGITELSPESLDAVSGGSDFSIAPDMKATPILF